MVHSPDWVWVIRWSGVRVALGKYRIPVSPQTYWIRICVKGSKSLYFTGSLGNCDVFGRLCFVHKPQLMDLRKPNTSLLFLAWTFPPKNSFRLSSETIRKPADRGTRRPGIIFTVFLGMSVSSNGNRGRTGVWRPTQCINPRVFLLLWLSLRSPGIYNVPWAEACLQKREHESQTPSMCNRLTTSFPVLLLKTHHWKCFFELFLEITQL